MWVKSGFLVYIVPDTTHKSDVGATRQRPGRAARAPMATPPIDPFAALAAQAAAAAEDDEFEDAQEDIDENDPAALGGASREEKLDDDDVQRHQRPKPSPQPAMPEVPAMPTELPPPGDNDEFMAKLLAEGLKLGPAPIRQKPLSMSQMEAAVPTTSSSAH